MSTSPVAMASPTYRAAPVPTLAPLHTSLVPSKPLTHYSIPTLLSILRTLSSDSSPLAHGQSDAYLSADQAARFAHYETIRRPSVPTIQEVSAELDGQPPRLPLTLDDADPSSVSMSFSKAQATPDSIGMGEELAARIMINFADPFGSAAYLVGGSGSDSGANPLTGSPTKDTGAPARVDSIKHDAIHASRYPAHLGHSVPVKAVGVGEKIGVIRLGARAPSVSTDSASASRPSSGFGSVARSRASSVSSECSPADEMPTWRSAAGSVGGLNQSMSTASSLNSLRTAPSANMSPEGPAVRILADKSADSAGSGSLRVSVKPMYDSPVSASLNPFAVPYLPARTPTSPPGLGWPTGLTLATEAAVPLPRTLPSSLPSKPGHVLPPVFIKRESAALTQPMALPDVAPMGTQWEGELGMSGNEKRRRASEYRSAPAPAYGHAPSPSQSYSQSQSQSPVRGKWALPTPTKSGSRAGLGAQSQSQTDKMGSWRGRPGPGSVKIGRTGAGGRPQYRTDSNRPDRLVRLGESLRETRAMPI